ncbi:hypothetical protein ACGTN9_01855 [Halobacillus sp. MO56]
MKKMFVLFFTASLLTAYSQVGTVQASSSYSEDGEKVVQEVEQFFIGAYEKSKESLQETNILTYLENAYDTTKQKVTETQIPTYIQEVKDKLLSMGEQFKQEFQQGMTEWSEEGIDRKEFADSSFMKVMNDFREIGESMKTLL